jgi:hypothetical protein
MIIEKASVNKKRKTLEIDTAKGHFSLPFSKLSLPPTDENEIQKIHIDPELGNEGITYRLSNGDEDSVHVDAFLDYNKDPEYVARITLYNLTRTAINLVQVAQLSKREIARKLRTSPAQLYRLLDTTNYKKTIDQMIKLLAVLGHDVGFILKSSPPPTHASPVSLKTRFPYLRDEDIRSTPISTRFKPLLLEHKLAA